MSNMVGVVVHIRVKPGRGAEQLALFAAIAPLVREEEGCLVYDLHPVVGDADAFVILEWWESADALAAHGRAPHMIEAGKRSPAFREGPAEITRIEPAV